VKDVVSGIAAFLLALLLAFILGEMLMGIGRGETPDCVKVMATADALNIDYQVVWDAEPESPTCQFEYNGAYYSVEDMIQIIDLFYGGDE